MPSLAQPQKPAAVLVTDQLETPLGDNRSYSVVTLPNKLEALIVHDADTDKASAALDVNVGSFSDYKKLLGIAHAIE
jgi:insulysin